MPAPLEVELHFILTFQESFIGMRISRFNICLNDTTINDQYIVLDYVDEDGKRNQYHAHFL